MISILSLVAFAVTALIFVSAVRPIVAVIIMLGFAFINPSILPAVVEFGELTVRYPDVVLGILTSAIWMRISLRPEMHISKEFKQLFGPLVPFLLYLGISLVNVSFNMPDFLNKAAVSYMRLLVTVFFAILLYMVVKNNRDLMNFHKALIGFGIATVGVGAWEALSGIRLGVETAVGEEVWFAGRFGGLLGFNALGLVAGLLTLYGFLKRDEKPRLVQWAVPLSFGLLGLFLSKSASSTFATAGAIAVYLVALHSPRVSVWRVIPKGIRKGVTIVVLAGAVALAVWAMRRGDVLGLFELSGGSFAQRLMIAYAGLKIFSDHPLLGVGWQASGTEAFIGDPALNATLMARFAGLPEHYFFLERPTSLHNMYIQILAELGIVGALLFIYACLRIGKVVARMLRNIPVPYSTLAKFYALGLVFLLIWWNTNPLFGGQTESLLAFSFLAILARLSDVQRWRAKALEKNMG